MTSSSDINSAKERKYDVAAYIWPAYTGTEPRTRIFWPEGMGEWETVREMRPRFEGHQWPRKPLWGYCDEANPDVMRMQIDAAADHGVNVFIYDWYWYDNRPFLEQCLNDGFLKAPNNSRMHFYLMWANHDATTGWDRRISYLPQTTIWQGAVNRAQFEVVAHRIIDQYFSHPQYYRIDGAPVFMIYDLRNLVKGLGGIKETRKALDWFRSETIKAGFPNLNLQLTWWNKWATMQSAADGEKAATPAELVTELGFNSVTHYQFVHAVNVRRSYPVILKEMEGVWEELSRDLTATYYPHVSVGWDANPRYKNFLPSIMTDTTPENIRKGFEAAKKFLDARPHIHPLVTVNSWNEWTETSYLQPDDINGYGYLEAVKSVFVQ